VHAGLRPRLFGLASHWQRLGVFSFTRPYLAESSQSNTYKHYDMSTSNSLSSSSLGSLDPSRSCFTRACLSILSHLNRGVTTASLTKCPLARCAAEHWFEHARFEGVLQIQPRGSNSFSSEEAASCSLAQSLDIDPTMPYAFLFAHKPKCHRHPWNPPLLRRTLRRHFAAYRVHMIEVLALFYFILFYFI
jgi:hypothetical protein